MSAQEPIGAALSGSGVTHASQPPVHWLEFARRESIMHRANGRPIKIEEVLRRNGFRTGEISEQLEIGPQGLWLYVSPADQAAMGLSLVGWSNGVLRVISASGVSDADMARIRSALEAGKIRVDDVEVELVDMSEFMRVVRNHDEVPADRLARLFTALAKDPDNAVLIERALKDIIAEALQSRASDVHLTSVDDDTRCWIRYRIDGDIVYRHLVPARVMAPLVTRIKTDARMDAAERNRPQDGRIAYAWQGRDIDVRVAHVPVSPSGEKITMRLLDAANLRSFDQLFAPRPDIAARLRAALHKRIKDGAMIVLAGPTGSGKSTTLFALVQEIDRVKREVYSVESPVEYDMPLVNQIEVKDDGKMDMADAVRALLRHDPDVIVVGEMRDADTIEAGLRATASGHLVITTVHAVNAAHTFDRINGFLRPDFKSSGLYILGQALTGVISQRLVRRLCPACKSETVAAAVLSPAQQAALGLTPDARVYVASPGGCSLCNGNGHIGRSLVIEALFPPQDHAVRRKLTEMLAEGRIAAIADLPGTIYISRKDSVAALVASGDVDAVTAALILADESMEEMP